MITNVNFFTPIRYEDPKTWSQYVLEGVEDYFYLGGKSAYVIPGKITAQNGQQVEIKNRDQNKVIHVILVAIKIISYMTVVIPLVLLALKATFRMTHTFHIVTATSPSAATFALIPSPSQPLRSEESVIVDLMDKFTKAWNEETAGFDFPAAEFNLVNFTKMLSKHIELFGKSGVDSKCHFGYIEKLDLDPTENPQIYMRADLHGDLKSLIENLRSLQGLGLLDKNYRCKPGIHLVFLGDYCDRGEYGTQILELLIRLREANPKQVHLIRGNHEYNWVNLMYGASDLRLKALVYDEGARAVLERFYETLSLTTYFSVDGGANREYIHCTHGLFEPAMDPAPLLDRQETRGFLPVPKQRKLSDRIRKIAEGNSKLAETAKRISEIVASSTRLEVDGTAYNWGDVSEWDSCLGGLYNRRYALNPQDIRHYLDLSSEMHRVGMLFRGHQHGLQHHMHEETVIATTLPVGMDSPAYRAAFDQPDCAYIINPKAKLADWTKRAILRASGRPATDEITDPYPLASSDI